MFIKSLLDDFRTILKNGGIENFEFESICIIEDVFKQNIYDMISAKQAAAPFMIRLPFSWEPYDHGINRSVRTGLPYPSCVRQYRPST